jgi:L-asparaginase II
MDDGNNSRACEAVLAALLQRLLPLDEGDREWLRGLAAQPLLNRRGLEVGWLSAAF